MEGRVHIINEIPDELNNGQGREGQQPRNESNLGRVAAATGGAAFEDRPLREQLLVIHEQIVISNRHMQDQSKAIKELKGTIDREFNLLNSNFRRMTENPPVFDVHHRGVSGARRRQGGAEQQQNNGTDRDRIPAASATAVAATTTNNHHHHPAASAASAGIATLSPSPRNLYTLWDEYIHGIGGRKAAQHFTMAERGKVKHKFTRRKIVWETIERLVKTNGLSANVAIDRIYNVYGGRTSSVTTIINRMRTDKKNRAIPAMLL
eukprot:scaffold596_cov87-Cylindrotheca_fusiformis.AAC.7